MYTVITENDESQWNDKTGERYHFPKKYAKYLKPGTQVIYYKGKIRNLEFRESRYSDNPYYFATAIIGKIEPDADSKKGDLFAEILNYTPLQKPVLAKKNNEYFEEIPHSKRSNYWRDGVRSINQETFIRITSCSLKPNINRLIEDVCTFESFEEGSQEKVYTTKYERNNKNRSAAIRIHGCTCLACGFNFREFYGNYAEKFIHIHHIYPVSEKIRKVNPRTDLIPLCANCHSVIHLKKSKTLTLEALKGLIDQAHKDRKKTKTHISNNDYEAIDQQTLELID